jgi:hypothetical protein
MFWPSVLRLIGRWVQPVATKAADPDEAPAPSGENAERGLEQP